MHTRTRTHTHTRPRTHAPQAAVTLLSFLINNAPYSSTPGDVQTSHVQPLPGLTLSQSWGRSSFLVLRVLQAARPHQEKSIRVQDLGTLGGTTGTTVPGRLRLATDTGSWGERGGTAQAALRGGEGIFPRNHLETPTGVSTSLMASPSALELPNLLPSEPEHPSRNQAGVVYDFIPNTETLDRFREYKTQEPKHTKATTNLFGVSAAPTKGHRPPRRTLTLGLGPGRGAGRRAEVP